jgi:hypothetical protein
MSAKIFVLRSATKLLNELAGWLHRHPAVIVRLAEFALGSGAALVLYGALVLMILVAA